jgi:sulfite reductase (NADPH) hemoprotein beta-component
MNTLYRVSVDAAEILPLVRPLLRRYASERLSGERFGDFVIRAGIVTPPKGPADFHDKTALGLFDEL